MDTLVYKYKLKMHHYKVKWAANCYSFIYIYYRLKHSCVSGDIKETGMQKLKE